jgi:tetratricopeptide (TPR) repeat protein
VSWWPRRRKVPPEQSPAPAAQVPPTDVAGSVGAGESGSIVAAGDIHGISSTGPYTTNVQYVGDRTWVSVRDSRGLQVGDHNTQVNVGVDGSSLPAAQRVAVGGVVDNLPASSGVFVGRDLTVLAGLLDGDASGVVIGQAAVHGLGGIGKTELVLQYARAYAGRYGLVWWVTADTVENVGLGLAALTARLHPVATLADAQAWAVGWLQSNPGWLLVLDNVEDVEDVAALLGQVLGRGHVVVTTRRDLGRARWTALRLAPLRLDVLDRPASVALLVGLTGLPDAVGADRLAADLGDLPLALEQAAAYISLHEGLGFEGYRALLGTRFARVALDGAEGGAARRTVASVWQVTMQALQERSALADRVLTVLGWLAPEALPEDVLSPLADDPADLGDALALLASYNMIGRGGGRVGVHRLVQAVTRTARQPAGMDEAVDLLAAAIPDDPINNVAGWPRWSALLPHIDALLANLPHDHDNATALYVGDRAATYRQFQGQTSEAVDLFQLVLTDQCRVLGDDHPHTLTTRHNLALAYRTVGRTTEAIDLYQQVLTDRRRVLGDDHPGTLNARHNLAAAYDTAGRTTEAIDLYQQVLTDRRRILGDDHPHTLTTRNNLAAAYHAAGRTTEAIDLFQRVLTDCRRVLGDDHPDTLNARHNLAGAYDTAGRTTEAIDLYQQVLTDRRRVLSDDHPATLNTRNNLAVAYHAAGRTTEAIDLFQRVLTDQCRVLGDDHPHTLNTRHNLALAYHAAGRTTEAIDLYQQVLADCRRVLGDDHPTTLGTCHNLAAAYDTAGRTTTEAIDLYQQVLTDRRRVLGDDHPDTLATRNDLAGAYRTAGRTTEAIDLYQQVLTDYRRVLGDDHPDTLTARHNLDAARNHQPGKDG